MLTESGMEETGKDDPASLSSPLRLEAGQQSVQGDSAQCRKA